MVKKKKSRIKVSKSFKKPKKKHTRETLYIAIGVLIFVSVLAFLVMVTVNVDESPKNYTIYKGDEVVTEIDYVNTEAEGEYVACNKLKAEGKARHCSRRRAKIKTEELTRGWLDEYGVCQDRGPGLAGLSSKNCIAWSAAGYWVETVQEEE